MSQALDSIRHFLPGPACLVLEGIDETPEAIVLRVRGRRNLRKPRCPTCSSGRVSRHSSYERRLRDVPWLGQPVIVILRVRRFRCHARDCPRRTFAEQIPQVAAPRARETRRSWQILQQFGYTLGGKPASRLLRSLGIATSGETVLRRVKSRSQPLVPNVRVLGVDDWAWRKRHGPAGRRPLAGALGSQLGALAPRSSRGRGHRARSQRAFRSWRPTRGAFGHADP